MGSSLARFVMAARQRRQTRRLLAKCLMPSAVVRVLGNGAFSTVYAVGRHRVLKVTDAEDAAAAWFSSYVRRRCNPHWPRIYRQVQIGRHVCTWMERLYNLDLLAERQVSCADDLLLAGKHHTLAHLIECAELLNWDEPWQRCPARFRQPLLDLYAAAERAGLRVDNKRSAFMRRAGGIIVLVDPFWAETAARRPGGSSVRATKSCGRV